MFQPLQLISKLNTIRLTENELFDLGQGVSTIGDGLCEVILEDGEIRANSLFRGNMCAG